MAKIETAGELRGFLADVLQDLRAKRLTPEEANAMAKVAGEITRSLAVEVQTAIHAGVKNPVPGSMVIASRVAESEPPRKLSIEESSDIDFDEAATEEPTKITRNITEPVAAAEQNPVRALSVSPEDAAANFRRNQDGDKIWCEQCEMRVTTAQAVGCKSAFCKAREAA